MSQGRARTDRSGAAVLADAGQRLRAAARLKTTVRLLGFLAALAAAWTLRETQMVTMPIAFAFFLAIAVWPVDAAVRARMPRRLRWLGPAAAMTVILLLFGIFLAGIWLAASRVAERLPRYADQAGEWWAALSGRGEGAGGASSGASGAGAQGDSGSGVAEALASRVGGGSADNILDRVASYADTILSSAASIGTGAVLVFFFALLMLIEAPAWRDKVRAVSTDGDGARWTASVTAIAQRFRWYLVVRTVLGAITGLLYGLWTWAFGLEFALVWGLLGFLLNYVPTLGSLVAGALPVAFAFFTKDIGTALLIGAGILVIEQVMGNFVDPRLQGKQLSLSPLVVLIAVVLWGWIWGIPGAILAVPMTVLVTIVAAHVRPLRSIGLMLSDERDFQGLDEKTRPM